MILIQLSRGGESHRLLFLDYLYAVIIIMLYIFKNFKISSNMFRKYHYKYSINFYELTLFSGTIYY